MRQPRTAAERAEPEHERVVRIYRSAILPTREKWDLSNPGNRLIEHERWQAVHEVLDRSRRTLHGKRILERFLYVPWSQRTHPIKR